MTRDAPTNPLRSHARLQRASLVVTLASTAALALWSLRPATLPDSNTDATAAASRVPASIDAPGDAVQAIGGTTAPLDVRLWHAPPPPPAPPPLAPPPPAAAPPPPMRLQLVAIMRAASPSSPEPPRAALFDPDAHQLTLACVGDTIGHFRVRAIHQDAIEVTDDTIIHRLELTRDVPRAAHAEPPRSAPPRAPR